MASIYKRGDIWWIHYSVGGKRVSRSLDTRNERVALDAKRRRTRAGHPSSTVMNYKRT